MDLKSKDSGRLQDGSIEGEWFEFAMIDGLFDVPSALTSCEVDVVHDIIWVGYENV